MRISNVGSNSGSDHSNGYATGRCPRPTTQVPLTAARSPRSSWRTPARRSRRSVSTGAAVDRSWCSTRASPRPGARLGGRRSIGRPCPPAPRSSSRLRVRPRAPGWSSTPANRWLPPAARSTRRWTRTASRDRWLACVPLHSVAGLAIVVRAATNGVPVTVHGGFNIEAVARAADDCTLVSLVPTQLLRLLEAGVPLERFRVVLLGGGPAPPGLVERAAPSAGSPCTPPTGSPRRSAAACTTVIRCPAWTSRSRRERGIRSPARSWCEDQ